MTFSEGFNRFKGIGIGDVVAVLVFIFGAFTYTEQRINSTRETCRTETAAAIDKLAAQLVAQMNGNREFMLQALRIIDAERKADENAQMVESIQQLISTIEEERAPR